MLSVYSATKENSIPFTGCETRITCINYEFSSSWFHETIRETIEFWDDVLWEFWLGGPRESPSKVVLEITLAVCNYTLLARVYNRLCAETHSRFLQRACYPFPSIQAISPLAFFSFVYTSNKQALQKPWPIKGGIIIVSYFSLLFPLFHFVFSILLCVQSFFFSFLLLFSHFSSFLF